ncbi:hypothetical protein [Enterococcus faecium]|uniref:hypothetical protein n=1 Tax=Enterococcus faecium TaxID=1352 RepID=UPI00338FEE38
MPKVARNAYKGYTYQHYANLFLIAMMDTERVITKVESEAEVDHNFDDIIVYADKKYVVQVKNYPTATIDDIQVKDNKVIIQKNVSQMSVSDVNIIFINSAHIQTEITILGMPALKKGEIYIIPFTGKYVEEKMDELYQDPRRILKIVQFNYQKCINSEFIISQENLPLLVNFSTDLEHQTVLLRNVISEFNQGVTFIIGVPGIGKSHYAREIKEEFPDAILYRFWTSSQDSYKNERLLFSEFIKDLCFSIFKTPKFKTVEELILKINEEKLHLIVDGLDHIENYNSCELDLYFDFFNQINLGHVLVLSRPITREITFNQLNLENWTKIETQEYLSKAHDIKDYSVVSKIFNYGKGYPIITFFLASHYKMYNDLSIDSSVDSIGEYYEQLLTTVKVKESLYLFLINDSFLTTEEIDILSLNSLFANVLHGFIEGYPYLFKICSNRVSLLHDSLNTYLRIQVNQPKLLVEPISLVFDSLKQKEIRYLSRVGSFDFNREQMTELLKIFSSFDIFKSLMRRTFDFESIQEFYSQLIKQLEFIRNELDIYQYFSLVLIHLVISRNDFFGDFKLFYQLVKYLYLNNITDTSIFSNGLLWTFYQMLVHDNEIPWKRLNNESNYSYSMNDIAQDFNSEDEFFELQLSIEELEEYLKEGLSGNYDRKNLLSDLLVSAFIHSRKDSKYYTIISKYLDNPSNEFSLYEMEKLCEQYEVNTPWSTTILPHAKFTLIELGIIRDENIFLDLTMDELIKESSLSGSFSTSENLISYIRLANQEKRQINICDVSIYGGMYYERKDYSVISLPTIFKIFEEKKLLCENESINIILNAMAMSEKGIRHLFKEYVKIKSV